MRAESRTVIRRLTTWVNGHLVSEFTADTKYSDVLLNRGAIGLQVHGNKGCPAGKKARFRNIQIKEM